jgi:hypothetical protein
MDFGTKILGPLDHRKSVGGAWASSGVLTLRARAEKKFGKGRGKAAGAAGKRPQQRRQVWMTASLSVIAESDTDAMAAHDTDVGPRRQAVWNESYRMMRVRGALRHCIHEQEDSHDAIVSSCDDRDQQRTRRAS